MLKSILGALALAALLSGPGLARELADAPHLRVIGFSENGRYFAYEQYLNDTVSGSVLASIDVVDRESGRSADGFPLGYLGLSKDGTYPLKVGDHAIELDESEPEEKRLATLRRRLRETAAARLGTLGIRDGHVRLAGTPPADRSQRTGPIAFVTGATLPGAVPDLQPTYRLTTRIAPADYATCINAKTKPQDHVIAIDIVRPDEKSAKAAPRSSTSVPWAHGENECASKAVVTDILVPEGAPPEGADHVVVLILAVSWAPHAEAARYVAAFAKLP